MHEYDAHKEHDAGHCHSDGGHGGHGMGHGSAEMFLRRFWIVTALLVPLVFTNEAIAGFFGFPIFALGKWVSFAIATVVFGFALVFFEHAWHEIKAKRYGMMTLVSLAVGAGYLFSVASTFLPQLEAEFYLEISTLVWVLLFGHYLEARSGAAAGNALQEVAKLLPKQAHRLRGDAEEEVDVSTLRAGDRVLVKPGERIPADGVVEKGTSMVNEAHISGESAPVEKGPESTVAAGAIALDGSLTVRLTEVGEHSTIGKIQALIREAQGTKPSSQRIADKAAAVLTFVAGTVAILTLLVWSLVVGQTFVFAMTLAITVLVIACPHALGLAIPAVTTITTTLASKNGMFIKNLAKVEVVRKADYVMFDKTGTLTTGEFGVSDVQQFADVTKETLLTVAGALERHSSHIIGIAIKTYADENGATRTEAANFKNIAGQGIEGVVDGARYFVGNKRLVDSKHASLEKEVMTAYEKLAQEGKTVVFVADEERVLGLIALSDTVKEESREAVRRLHDMGVKVAMLTGDNEKVAKAVADELKIDTYFAEVLPEDKYAHVKELQEKGNVVIMVGDGVNDAPALTQADAGVAIGAGTDVAVEAGDVVLTRSNPQDLVRLIVLAKKVYRKMIQNLVWALGYNIIAIPLAAGVFASDIFFGGFIMRPEIGALVMSLSTVIVVANSLTLKRINLQDA